MPVTTIRGGRQITDGTIPYVDIQNVTASRLVGNPTGSAVSMSEISLGTGLSFSGSSVVVSTNLQSLSGLTYSSAAFVKMTAAGTFALDTATYYLASNPNGYTNNTGTVTSVSGTGTVSGLTLSGTVTGSGSLTLGGTLSLTSGNVTTALGYTPYNSTNPNSYITAAQTYYIGTTLNALNRSSAAQTLTGVSIDGNAGTATILQTSRSINGTSFNGSANISTTEWYHSDRDFPNGTLITTNINYASTNGDPFVLEIRGNSYGNIIPLDLIYQGYIYDDTIINHGGISNGHSITGLVAINVGGVLCFWFPTQGYWQGYNVKVYIAYATRAINQVTSITSTSKPTSTKEVSLSANIRQSLHSTNYNTYAPTLTGGGASGNWGINVTGYSTQVLSRTVTNVNTQRSAGYLEYYDALDTTGAPSTGWYSFISVRHGNNSNQYGFQFANGFGNETLYWRGWDGTNPTAWRTIVHSGNIGSFETDTLATVMTRGASSSTFMTLTGGGLFSGNEYTFRSNVSTGVYLGNTTTVRLQAYSDDGGAAFMTFHRSNSWAVNMGLDPDNVFRIGGFSASANRLQLNMSGDLTVAGSVNSTTNITVGTDIYLTQLTSPNTSTIRFGDNTGWTFRFQTSVSNTWTTRFSFGDNGTFTAVGDVIAYSDARVKTNVVTIKDSLEKVQQLRGVTYNRTDSTDDSEKIGVIAQEIQKVLPQVVTKDADGMLGVSYGNLAGVFIEAIKEQQTQIEDLKKQIQYLVENR